MGIGYIYICECVSCAILFFLLPKERKKKKEGSRETKSGAMAICLLSQGSCNRLHFLCLVYHYKPKAPHHPTEEKKKEKNPSILSLSVFLLDLFPPTFFLSLPQLLLRLKKMTFGLILMNQSQHTRIHQTIFRRN